MKVSIEISKSEVIDLVARDTAYKGAKREGDENAFDRISTIDEDEEHLTTFFEECRVELMEAFGKYIVSEGMGVGLLEDKYIMELNVAETFNLALLPGLSLGVRNFFVHGILARWYEMIGDEAYTNEYAKSVSYLDIAKRKTVVTSAFTRKITTM